MWDRIANNRVLPTLPQGIQAQLNTRQVLETTLNQQPIQYTPGSLFEAFVSFLFTVLRHVFFLTAKLSPERTAAV